MSLRANLSRGRSILTGALPLAALGYSLTATPVGQTAKVDYAHDVQPILKAHCYRCHSGDQKSGGLTLDALSAILHGGDSGPSAVASKASQSLLLQRIEGKLGLPRMPMGFGPLEEKDIGLISAWIDQGCVESIKGRTVSHWAFVKPVRPHIPVVQNRVWVRNPIDAFVLSRLEHERLKPSPEADRPTLIRRVTLDLIGLPPTPAEVDAFVADRSRDAYERVVDRLLASPHYGEKMALPWLDAARYADSNGFQTDGDNFQYVWRDWVVKALNDNMPFDRFTIEQIAGDLLPNPTQDQIVATGFNRNHMLNGEGGAIPEEQRSIALFDRVDTTATTWLGLTMTCARCHDHKYDPLTQRDYYSLMAYFNNLPETGLVSTGGQYNIADPWIYAGTPAQMQLLQRLESELTVATEAAKPFEDRKVLAAAQAAWEEHALADIKAKQGQFPDEIEAILKTQPASRKPESAAKLLSYYLENVMPEPGRSLHNRRLELEKQRDDLKARLPKVMIMADKQPRKTYIFSRGNYTVPLAEVTPATPATLPQLAAAPKNRLGLAEWMVSPTNPLTARVQVNRFWQTLFGKGLVRTPENFGIQGERPTHPELLDWLAVDFQESGWNVKRLVRLIVTSATYRQSSKVSKALLDRDPDNRLLARGGRFRLPSPLLRDEALAASGLLNPAIGGKPVYPYQPKGIWDSLNITDERDFTYPQSKGSDLYRRSIYTFWRRTVGPGDMFDAATRQICTVRLSQTSTPLHALTTLNDVTWVEAGRVLAERVMTTITKPEARLAEAFRRVCARRPDATELGVLKRALQRSLTAFKSDTKLAAQFLSQGESPQNKNLNPPEEAAYANVCLLILNLDEALTRE